MNTGSDTVRTFRESTIGSSEPHRWWERDGLGFFEANLCLDQNCLGDLAEVAGRPLFVYSAKRIARNIERLRCALDATGLGFQILYAMKANRFGPLLQLIRSHDVCGIDVCSPGEMALALDVGFDESRISYTGTATSNQDVDSIVQKPGIMVNCDALSTLRKLGARAPGRSVGIRINPGIGIGYRENTLLRYAGGRPTKFGIYRPQFDDALDLAASYGLMIEGIHFHCGCGYLTPQLPLLTQILEAAQWFISRVPNLRYINIGGGLGIPLVAEDAPLDLAEWSDILKRHLGSRDITLFVEPGDYIVKDAGVLVLQVNTVEQKEQTMFVGVNGGFSLHPEPTFYRLPLHAVPCRLKDRPPQRVTIAGNINEAHDLLAEDIELPEIEEGDYLGFLNAGGYGSAMSSNHCLRGDFEERLI